MHCAICDSALIVDPAPLDGLTAADDGAPELICTGCGSAIISTPLTGRVWWRPRGARIAPQQRRAA